MSKGKSLIDLVESATKKIKNTKDYNVFPTPKSSFGVDYDKLSKEQYINELSPYDEDVYPDGVSAFDAMFDDIAPIGSKTVYPDIDPYDFIDKLNFRINPPVENSGNFVQKENIDNIYDMYLRGLSSSSMLSQIPKKYRDVKSFREDFGSGDIESEFKHIFSQTYKDDIAQRLGVEPFLLHIEPKISNNIDFPYITDIQSGSIRVFDGVVNPGEVVTIPKKMVADEFYQNPNKLLASVREFQGFVDESNAAEYDDLIGSLKSLSDPTPTRPKPKKPSLSIVKNNNIKSIGIGGGGIIGSALLSPEEAIAQSSYSTLASPVEMIGHTLANYQQTGGAVARAPVANNLIGVADAAQKWNDWRENNLPAPVNFLLPGQPDPEYIRNRAYGREPTTWEKIKFGLSFL